MSNIARSIIMVSALGAGATLAIADDIPPNTVASDSQLNTAMGTSAMNVDTTGTGNTAAGAYALDSDYQGSQNTAVGSNALTANGTGNDNTAVGFQSLLLNQGNSNTGLGSQTLKNNTTGVQNTAVGQNALIANTTGGNNVASGYEALERNTSGSGNLAEGMFSMYYNTSGANNAAVGYSSLDKNTNGNNNAALGNKALYSNTTGSSNIGLGANAGYNLTTGSNNIDIGNQGVAGETGVIRIGAQSTQTKTFVAGIYGTSVSSGTNVVVNSSGQLGVVTSSERFKTDIAPMVSNGEKLERLRPVTFHYKTDPRGNLQYGLIAEEVAKVYPDLVVRSESGRIDGVRYEELTPILLKEVQDLRGELRETQRQNASLMREFAELRAAVTQAQAKERMASNR